MWLRRRALLCATIKYNARNEPARAGHAHDGAKTESFAAVSCSESGAGRGSRRTPRRRGSPTGLTMETDLQRLAAACNKAAEHYCEHPGTAGPETVVDIYRAMAALASMLDRQATTPIIQKRLH